MSQEDGDASENSEATTGWLENRFGKRTQHYLRVGGVSAVLLSLLSMPVAANCPGLTSGFSTFLNNAFTLVTLGGAVAAATAAGGSWAIAQTKGDPQQQKQWKEKRNSAGQAAVGLAGFAMLWDLGLGLLPSGAFPASTNPSSCISALTLLPTDAVVGVAAAMPDVVTVLA